MTEWKHGLFGCFDDLGTCLLAYFVPCYLVGKDAEAVGNSCVLCCIAFMFFAPCVGTFIRKEIREKQNIDGGVCTDFLVNCFCGCCAVAQMHNEVRHMTGSMGIERE